MCLISNGVIGIGEILASMFVRNDGLHGKSHGVLLYNVLRKMLCDGSAKGNLEQCNL